MKCFQLTSKADNCLSIGVLLMTSSYGRLTFIRMLTFAYSWVVLSWHPVMKNCKLKWQVQIPYTLVFSALLLERNGWQLQWQAENTITLVLFHLTPCNGRLIVTTELTECVSNGCFPPSDILIWKADSYNRRLMVVTHLFSSSWHPVMEGWQLKWKADHCPSIGFPPPDTLWWKAKSFWLPFNWWSSSWHTVIKCWQLPIHWLSCHDTI